MMKTRSRVPRIIFGLCAWCVILLLTTEVGAGQVRCPVCNQIFDHSTQVCPNDGSDLDLEGVPVPGDSDEETDTPAPPAADEPAEEGEVGAPPAPAEKPKYRRHDRGGERSPGTKKERSGYSDRRSRIKTEYRGGSAARAGADKERREAQEAEEKRLREQQERLRQSAWRDRKDAELKEEDTRLRREVARQTLLNSQAAPLTSLGVRFFWMPEGDDSGPVTLAEMDLNLSRSRLRAGISSAIGIRALPSRSDLTFMEWVNIGVQYPWRFSPYAMVRGGVGLQVSERYSSDIAYLMTAIGAEVGVDSWVNPWVSIGVGVGYVRTMIRDAYWNSFTAKLAVGF